MQKILFPGFLLRISAACSVCLKHFPSSGLGFNSIVWSGFLLLLISPLLLQAVHGINDRKHPGSSLLWWSVRPDAPWVSALVPSSCFSFLFKRFPRKVLRNGTIAPLFTASFVAPANDLQRVTSEVHPHCLKVQQENSLDVLSSAALEGHMTRLVSFMLTKSLTLNQKSLYVEAVMLPDVLDAKCPDMCLKVTIF